jgi:coenzyme Q-binding protein COQ10
MAIHIDRETLPYSPEQVFGLVADVERYPEFLPWLTSARIDRRDGSRMWVEMLIDFHGLRGRLASEASLEPPERIDILGKGGPFRCFAQHWRFSSAEGGHTTVELAVEFELWSHILQAATDVLQGEIVRAMVAAFKGRARDIYRTEGVPAGV